MYICLIDRTSLTRTTTQDAKCYTKNTLLQKLCQMLRKKSLSQSTARHRPQPICTSPRPSHPISGSSPSHIVTPSGRRVCRVVVSTHELAFPIGSTDMASMSMVTLRAMLFGSLLVSTSLLILPFKDTLNSSELRYVACSKLLYGFCLVT